MNITVIGAGYVGLVTSATLAYIGHNVINVETNSHKLQNLKNSIIPFFEPHIEEITKYCVAQNRLEFTSDANYAIKKSQIIFIAVGTPQDESGQPDLTQLENAAKSIGQALDSEIDRIIINKSTVPIGSGNWVEMLINHSIQQAQLIPARAGSVKPINFRVASNPEFLREGSALFDSLYPDRIVLGVAQDDTYDIIYKLYEPIIHQTFEPPKSLPRPKDLARVPFIKVDLTSAELIKYAANSFLAMKISFANEISNISEKVGADINDVMDAIGLDTRIGRKFLNAGIGWGGSCFKKDVNALINMAKEYNLELNLLPATINVNENQRLVLIRKLQEELRILKGRTIGVLGLSFKPNTDDLRDAPSITIINQLIKLGSSVKVYDPIASNALKYQYPNLNVNYCSSIEEVANLADAIIIVTEWQEFITANWTQILNKMTNPLIIDGRNCLDKNLLEQIGFKYKGIGF